MKISLEQKQELITQIANNLTGRFITSLFNVQIGEQNLFTFTECSCPLFNRQSNDFRHKLESYLHNFIINNYDTQQTINLINIGGDWTGLTIILAKLYLSGYKNINLAVLDDAPEYYEMKKKHMEFWVELFSDDFKISYDPYYIHGTRVNENICNTVYFQVNPLFYTNNNLLVFAEDLGGNIIANNAGVKNFVTAVKLARDHNFDMVQSSISCNKRKKQKLQYALDAINQGTFEQKILFITSDAVNKCKFNVECSTLSIQQDMNRIWRIVDDRQILKVADDEILVSQANIANSAKKPKIQEKPALLFSNIASSSSSSTNTFIGQSTEQQDLCTSFQPQEQQDFLLAKMLQQEEEAKMLQEEADYALALSLQM